MRKLFGSVIFIFLFHSTRAQSSHTGWTVGPMFHFYFGKHFDFTMGLELAMWKENFSVDFGVEGFSSKRIIIYSEFQKGRGFANESFLFVYGASLGPSVEIRNDSLSYVHLGVQGSCWVALFFGIDARARWTKDSFTFNPGTFLKIPVSGKSGSWH